MPATCNEGQAPFLQFCGYLDAIGFMLNNMYSTATMRAMPCSFQGVSGWALIAAPPVGTEAKKMRDEAPFLCGFGGRPSHLWRSRSGSRRPQHALDGTRHAGRRLR